MRAIFRMKSIFAYLFWTHLTDREQELIHLLRLDFMPDIITGILLMAVFNESHKTGFITLASVNVKGLHIKCCFLEFMSFSRAIDNYNKKKLLIYSY